MPDIGPVIAQNIADFFNDITNQTIIADIIAAGVNWPDEVPPSPNEQPLLGQTWVLTGTLEKLTRTEAKALLESLGAKVAGSVSKKTACVVVGKDAGSKLKTAETLGIKILDESAFIAAFVD